ncbi:hypothetical protein ACFY0F_00960 [Streptomyces sp. NPDC001544]|uniref:hypothetical protein n=1 Tax=Streptomyces sp. NPDC001544 TaxID=3364584 RepID=UPI003694522D
MTAAHDGSNGYDGSHGSGYGYGYGNGYDGDDELDALMAVLADEPLPGEARADAAFMAGHRAATADVALLREQLGIIGDALAGPEPRPRPATRAAPAGERWYRHPGVRTLSFGALVTAAVASVVLGLGWLVVSNHGVNEVSGGSASDKSVSGGSAHAPARFGCPDLVVEGDITKVQRVPGTDEDRVTLRVTRHYVPEKGKGEVTFLVARETVPDPRPGQHVLAALHKGLAQPARWLTDTTEITRERAAYTKKPPKPGPTTCE